jgi:Ca-activated chloride channel homolog
MRNRAAGLGLLVGLFGILSGCAKAPPAQAPAASLPVATGATDAPGATIHERAKKTDGAWIGAAAEGEMLGDGTRETFLGVWVDIPEREGATRPEVRPPMEVALVVDTSGSMAGAKLQNARAAASTLVRNLKDGDIVALDAFSDEARVVVPPTRLSASSRETILRAIAALDVSGSTNMFAGLTLGEGQVAAAPPTHAIRRVVVISDGIANVGPSSPEVLGQIAERGLRHGAQVTSLGVGNDYDERTLNALAVRSSGRLYHLSEPREMASTLSSELALLDATVANDALVEIVPAPGIELASVDGARSEWGEHRSLRIPLGALHAGQHREALVRVRISDPELFRGKSHALASVRLRFRDAQDSDLERVQEVVARTQLTHDEGAIARTADSRTKAIMALQEAAKIQVDAAARMNEGAFDDADQALARAQSAIAAQAALVQAPEQKKRLAEAQNKVAAARRTTQAAPSKPKAAQRADVLEMNASGMKAMGF